MGQNIQRKILLPKSLDERLTTLAGLSQETVGVLFYASALNQNLLELRIDGLFMLGRGHRYAVMPEKVRWGIMERFLKDNPKYGSIHWHTHPSGTKNVAGTDLVYFRAEIVENPDFLAMIITQRKKVTIAYGQGTQDTSVAVVPDPADFAQRNAYVNNGISDAAMSLGYRKLPRLQAMRARQT